MRALDSFLARATNVNGHMKKFTTSILLVLLSMSLVANIALFLWGDYWKNALVNQFITTYEVEQIFIKSGAHLSFEEAQEIAQMNGQAAIELVGDTASKYQVTSNGEYRALKIDDTILLFRNNTYIGSKSIHPDH